MIQAMEEERVAIVQFVILQVQAILLVRNINLVCSRINCTSNRTRVNLFDFFNFFIK